MFGQEPRALWELWQPITQEDGVNAAEKDAVHRADPIFRGGKEVDSYRDSDWFLASGSIMK